MPLLGISLGDCDVSGKPAMTQEGLRPNPVYLPGLEAVVAGTFPVKLTAMFPPLFQFPWIALGREDFMAQFRVTFDQRALTTTLEAHDDVEALPHEWWWTPAGGQTDARGSASD